MKTWAWILGGVGAATGAWLLFRNRTSETGPPMSDVSWYPDGGLLEPVGTGETATESSAVGTPTGEANAAPPVSTYYVEPAPNTAASSDSATSMDTGAPQSNSVSATFSNTREATGSQVAPSGVPKDTVGVPQFVPLVPRPAKVSVTTYRSPVTSSTRTVVAPVIPRAPLRVMTPRTVSPKPTAITPLTQPSTVARPTTLRGVYAVGADFTEAEYRALGARAEIETRHREWAASQMSNQIAALQRDR